MIDTIGVILVGVVIFSWIESNLPKSKRRKLEEYEMENKAKRDLILALNDHMENKNK